MNILNIKIGTGKLCALVATTLFFTAILLAFPGIIPAVFATAIKYAVPMLTIAGAGLAFVYGLAALEKRFPGILTKFLEKSGEYFHIALVCFMIAMGLIAFVSVEYSVLAASWAVIQGTSIDSSGTIIPISPIAVVALHVATLMGTVCFGRHCLYAALDPKGAKWLKVTISTIIALAVMIVVSGLVGMAIRNAYLDHSAERKADLVERIEKKQESLDKLKQELLQLEAAGK